MGAPNKHHFAQLHYYLGFEKLFRGNCLIEYLPRVKNFRNSFTEIIYAKKEKVTLFLPFFAFSFLPHVSLPFLSNSCAVSAFLCTISLLWSMENSHLRNLEPWVKSFYLLSPGYRFLFSDSLKGFCYTQQLLFSELHRYIWGFAGRDLCRPTVRNTFLLKKLIYWFEREGH